ncbi:MAG: alpha/beta hydrolase [Corynebacterium sp.]|nr:alpha/beta hydrolase [Corynebacterium sp.]
MNLEAARTALIDASRAATELHTLLLALHHQLFRSGFAGEAADALSQALAKPLSQLDVTAQQILSVAQLIEELAIFEQRLEQYRLVGPITDTVAGFESLGRALDWMCARNIDALCTPSSAPPPRYLEDFGDLDLVAISEINRLSSSPAIAQLADAHPDLLLLESGDNHLVALIDPEHAVTSPAAASPPTITTFVSGVGSSDPQHWNGSVNRARTMAQATGGPVAIWLGYNAPSSVPRALAREPARRSAGDLVRFQRSLTRRFPLSHTAVVGYSYGSVVTGYAAREGLVADDLVFVGSPGVGAHRANDLHFPGRIHAVTADGDFISLTAHGYGGIHGADPTSPTFGANQWSSQPRGDHSSYWDSPDFLNGLARLNDKI